MNIIPLVDDNVCADREDIPGGTCTVRVYMVLPLSSLMDILGLLSGSFGSIITLYESLSVHLYSPAWFHLR